MDISVKIAYRNEKLQAARLAAGMSQSQLAAAAGISVRILQDYERGARDINGAKLATLLKICNALECNLRDIISDPKTLELLKEYEKEYEKKEEQHSMYILTNSNRNIIGWDLETGEHGVFTHTAQQATFLTEEEAWNYMDLLERMGLDVSDMTTEEVL